MRPRVSSIFSSYGKTWWRDATNNWARVQARCSGRNGIGCPDGHTAPRLKVQEGYQVGVCLSGGYLKATIRPSEQGEQREIRIQQYLQNWYRTRALEHLQEKANRYAQQIGVTPAGVSVRNFKSRWGSCDKKGQVVFNWNIIKAPHAIADYVVVHELCHLIHPNHSKDFWQLVGRHDPAYAEHRQWLKERGEGLL